MTKTQLNGNQLKVLAMVAMTLDHIGAYLFPQVMWLRIIGRLAFPIYAFLIAEGCHHTRSMGRYLGSVGVMAAICQIVYFFAMDSLYMCILVTFSLSIGLIWLLKFAATHNQNLLSRALVVLGVLAVYFLCEILPGLLPGTDYSIDYGFFGVLVPVVIYCAKDKASQMVTCLLALVCLAAVSAKIQWWSLLSLIPLVMYNGQRGRYHLKWFFYLFYPAHLLVIYGIGLLL